VTKITTEERNALERLGVALRVRRQIMALRPKRAAALAGLSENHWRRLEHGSHAMQTAAWLRACKSLGLDLNLIVRLLERALISDLNKTAVIQAANRTERRGRPRKSKAPIQDEGGIS
jgi:hypothetical protein